MLRQHQGGALVPPTSNAASGAGVAVVLMYVVASAVIPETYNDDVHVAVLFNIVVPDTFNDDVHAVVLFNVVDPETFNDELHVIVLFIVPDAFQSCISP